jgi:hypothetical protein
MLKVGKISHGPAEPRAYILRSKTAAVQISRTDELLVKENGDLTAVQIPESESFKSAVCLEDIDIGDGRLYQNRAFCAAVTRRFC